jgi:stearoyl-CoA desaturase (Delta-9 desaturase)
MFNGGVYDHNNAAHNLLSTMRVGVLSGGCEVEILKRAHAENKNTIISTDSFGNEIVRGNDQITRVQQPLASANAA